MLQRAVSLGLVLLLASVGAAQVDYFVDANTANPPGTGTKADPFLTITAALGLAGPGDRIFVAPGTYGPTTTGDSIPMQLGSSGPTGIDQTNVQLIGVQGPSATIIDGEGAATWVLRMFASAAGCRVSGFTIRNSASSLGIVRLGSTSPNFIAVDNEISNCIIENNSVGSGIATFGDSSGLRIHGNIIQNCTDNGLWLSSVTSGSSTGAGGGDVYNNTIVDNGHGIRLQGGTWNVFNNNVASNNLGGAGHFGIFHECCLVGTFSYTLDYNNVFGNMGGEYGVNTDMFCTTGGGGPVAMPCAAPTAGPNATSVDPLFVSPPPGGDYRLLPNSPLIDAGTGALPGYVGSDIDRDPRIVNGGTATAPDVGADEVTDVNLSLVGNASISFGAVGILTMGPPGAIQLKALSNAESNFVVAGTGNLLLDITGLFLLDPVPTVIDATGGSLLGLPLAGVPPALIGTTFYLQAIVSGPGAQPSRFTNLAIATICP